MAVAAACGACGTKLKLPDASYFQKKLKCPKCGEAMTPRPVKAKPAAGGGPSPPGRKPAAASRPARKPAPAKRPARRPRPAPAEDDPFGGLDDLLEQDRRNAPLAPLPPAGTPGKAKARPRKKSAGGGGDAGPIVAGVAAFLLAGAGVYFLVSALGGPSGPGGEGGAMAWLPADSLVVATLRPPELDGDSVPADARRQVQEMLDRIAADMDDGEFTLKDVPFVAIGAKGEEDVVATIVSPRLAENFDRPQRGLQKKSYGGYTVWEGGVGDGFAIGLVADDLIVVSTQRLAKGLFEAGPAGGSFEVDRSLPLSVWADVKGGLAAAGVPLPAGGEDLMSRAAREAETVRLDVADMDYPVAVDVSVRFSSGETAGEVATLATTMGPVFLGGLNVLDRPGQMPDWLKITGSGNELLVDLDVSKEVAEKLAAAAEQQAGMLGGGFGGPGFGPPGGGMGGPPGFGPPGGFGSGPGFGPPEGFGEGESGPGGGEDAASEGPGGGGFFEE